MGYAPLNIDALQCNKKSLAFINKLDIDGGGIEIKELHFVQVCIHIAAYS